MWDPIQETIFHTERYHKNEEDEVSFWIFAKTEEIFYLKIL